MTQRKKHRNKTGEWERNNEEFGDGLGCDTDDSGGGDEDDSCGINDDMILLIGNL